ncbi:28119_t:CDS:1 [Gigaspora margarita]|uniref:28119_t:CDS:1 n=1 Tax=Gigaspora margarita TaxID=4874 RepID=A0ABN7VNA2_GIGMA|nr:28119_t:CDS:1 [Gigaspora margarita]
MSIFLLEEILVPILELFEDETQSLHSCLLVNRFWCHCAVPILWRYPFEDRWSGRHFIVNSYLECLDECSKEWLIKFFCGIFPTSVLDIQPAFDYIKFLRKLDYQALHQAIEFWCKYKGIDTHVIIQDLEPDYVHPTSVILDILIDLIVERSTNLSKLSMSVVSHREGEFLDLSQYEEFACTFLPKLQFLDCDDCIPGNLLFASRIATNLSKLNIECSWGNDVEIFSLLKSQKKLQHLTVTKRWPHLDKDALENEILSNSLTRVDFINNRNLIDNGGPLCVLSVCKNLEILRFDDWKPFREDDFLTLATTSFPRLRKLVFTRCKPPPIALATMITTNGLNLQEFILTWQSNERSNPRHTRVIQAIACNCPNLTYLDVPIEIKDLQELNHLLCNCRKLESLTINTSANDNKEDFYYPVDDFLKNMGLIIPKTLNQLKIFAPWKFSAESLQEFLETCQALIKCMELYRWINDEHLAVVTRYAKEKKNLKVLILHWTETTFPVRQKAREAISDLQAFNSIGRRIE